MRHLFSSGWQKLRRTSSHAASLLSPSAQTESNLRYFCSPCCFDVVTNTSSSLKSYLRYICAPCCLDIMTLDQPVIAGVLMHGPGLYVKWSFERWPDYFQSITSAAAEGVFLLMLGAHAFGSLKRLCSTLASATSVGVLPRAFASILASILALLGLGFVTSAILTDATYRVMFGNVRPTEDVLLVDFESACSNVVAQFQYEPLGATCRVFFAVLCSAGSVYLYVNPLRNWQEEQQNEPEQGLYDIDTGVTVKPDIVAPTHQETESLLPTYSARRCAVGRRESLFKIKLPLIGILLGFAVFAMNASSWYTPVTFAYVTIMTEFFSMTDDGSVAPAAHQRDANGYVKHKSDGTKPTPTPGSPNIIYIQHESLSGSIALITEEGIRAMPFFQEKMHKDPDMYVFEHARTVSGQTIDAFPALLTGCLPYTDEAVEWVHTPGRSLAYDFRDGLGYDTASFTGRHIDGEVIKGKWEMMYDLLTGAMEKILDPKDMGWPKQNSNGSDDRKLLKEFKSWLAELDDSRKTDANSPIEDRASFYAQFYLYNTHFPFFKDPNNPSPFNTIQTRNTPGKRFYDSLVTTDQFLKSLFDILDETGRLKNTIIIGSGDHGDDPLKRSYVRNRAYTSNVLQVAPYIYYPRHLMPNPGIGERLRRNTKQPVHILDLFPTTYSISHGGGGHDNAAQLFQQHFPDGCITGVDLTSVDIPDDRVTISWNKASARTAPRGGRPNAPKPRGSLWALHARDPQSGEEFSLYHRDFTEPHKAINQNPVATYVLLYGKCLKNTNFNNLCMSGVKDSHKALFRKAISWIKTSQGFFDNGVRSSELVEFFSTVVGWEETSETK